MRVIESTLDDFALNETKSTQAEDNQIWNGSKEEMLRHWIWNKRREAWKRMI